MGNPARRAARRHNGETLGGKRNPVGTSIGCWRREKGGARARMFAA